MENKKLMHGEKVLKIIFLFDEICKLDENNGVTLMVHDVDLDKLPKDWELDGISNKENRNRFWTSKSEKHPGLTFFD